MEIIALEYRQKDFADAEALAARAAQVADACVERKVEAVSMVGLLQGCPLGPGLVFGLRADDIKGAALFADAIGQRGYAGVLTFRDVESARGERIGLADWVGLGLLPVQGGDEVLLKSSAKGIAKRLAQPGSPWANIWMPAPDELGRAVDGLILEEARRQEVALIWTPGSGLNDDEMLFNEPALLRARVDDGQMEVQELAAFCAGDSFERGRAQVMRFVDTSRRWFNELSKGLKEG